MRLARVCALAGLLATGAMSVATACSSFGADGEVARDGGAMDSVAADGGVPAPACNEAKLDSDAFHCGRCGHSCLGGACVAGTCMPVEVGRSVGEYAVDVAVDRANVFWTTSTSPQNGAGHVYACPKSGCGNNPPKSLAPEGSAVGALAGNGTDAYVSFLYGHRKISKITSDNVLETQGTGSYSAAVRLEVTPDGKLRFLSLFEPPTVDGGKAGRLALWDPRKNVETTLGRYDYPTSVNIRDGLAVGDRAFFASPNTIDACDDKASCTRLTGAAENSVSFATDGALLYWAPLATNAVLSCPLAGCAVPVPILGNAQLSGDKPRTVLFDAGQLYVMTSGGAILACNPSDCPGTLRTIANGSRFYVHVDYVSGRPIAADATAIYWAALEGTFPDASVPPDSGPAPRPDGVVHRIMKLAK